MPKLFVAGSIITSGSGQVQVETVYHESRIARMTEGIRAHSLSLSPIQQSVSLVVRYTGYALIVAVAFAIGRSFVVNEPVVSTVLNIGTLASMFVPQGLVFAITLFFAYGAANLFQKNVLLQEINATEKLGRIKNLCMDKTGTLTENTLSVEAMHVVPGVDEQDAQNLVASYIHGTADESETVHAVSKFLKNTVPVDAAEVQPFSSWRQYGAVLVKRAGASTAVFVGSPDVFIHHLSDDKQKQWLADLIATNSREGKRVLCIAQAKAETMPKDLASVKISIVSAFVFHNNIREGIADTVNFFQNRGVRIRIISGDNPDTVSAVARAAGVRDPEKVTTGSELAKWSVNEFDTNVKEYTIFARIVPEQKEKIIEALKKDGFTAMVGDGANDALAIKKADLGIAMFDGSPATRQLASIVLVNNSFTALPGGVELADGVIRNIETFSSVVFNQTFIGGFLFIALSLFGREYPLTPFNVTLINYFAIGVAGTLVSYWTIAQSEKVPPVSKEPFLKRVVPLAVWSAVIQTAAIALIYVVNALYFKVSPPNTIILLSFIAVGFAYFSYIPAVYQGLLSWKRRFQIFYTLVIAAIILTAGFHVSIFLSFFNVVPLHLPVASVCLALGIIVVFCLAQYAVARKYAVQSKA